MVTKGNTILITGGGSGIGFETAKAFAENENKVILAGRNEKKLQEAVKAIPGAHYITADITDEESISHIIEQLKIKFPSVNILLNNAGVAHAYRLQSATDISEKAKHEIDTNYLANLRLTEKMIPMLLEKPNAAIINNSSVTAFVPGVIIPTYSASKAALHSYTQSLRYVLHQQTSIKVFEIMPPLTDTEFSKSLPGKKMHPAQIAHALMDGLKTDTYEIYPGITAEFYQLYLQSPAAAFELLNKTA